jgi:flavin reductase (DIM6/NTAB) family NADH-FMN oxidoreductase RutF
MKKSIGAKTIVYPTPVFVVGTYDNNQKPNVMTAAWGGISCSMPPCVSISLRKATYSYGNILEKEAFTINIPSENFLKEADYFGITSGRDLNKFSITNLTPVKAEMVDAPYISEFPLILECKLLNTLEIGLHTQFTGEIMDVKVEDSLLGEGDVPDIEKVKPFLYAPDIAAYYGIGKFLGKAFSIGRNI